MPSEASNGCEVWFVMFDKLSSEKVAASVNRLFYTKLIEQVLNNLAQTSSSKALTFIPTI